MARCSCKSLCSYMADTWRILGGYLADNFALTIWRSVEFADKRIIAFFYAVSLNILQLQHDGGRVDILARDEHQVGKALTRGLLLTTSISPDLSTYSPLRIDWNPALPILIYVPIIFTLIRKLSNDSAKIQHKSNEGNRKGRKSAKISQKIRLMRYFC